MVLLCPLAFGQSTPAATSWQKYPTPAPAGALPPPPPVPGAGAGASAPGSRVVLFSKPAGEVRPVQNTEPVKKEDEKKKDDDKPKADKTKEEKKADQKPAVVPADPFSLRTDDDLAAEIDRDRDYAGLLKQYQKDLPEIERKHKLEMEKFRRGDLKSEPIMRSPPLRVPALDPPAFQPAVQVKAGYAPAQAVLEPSYVVHRRLYFEEKNSERYGWDLGFAQPFVSAGVFFKDVLFWPSHLTSNLFERYDTSAGKCPPGSPVAYYLYPPNITFRGGLVETAAVIGTIALLP